MHKRIIKYALVLLATASSIFAWTQASCSDYNLNTNGIDFCYDIGNVNYLPCNTTDTNCTFTFDAYGNITSEMNYIANTTNMYGENYYNAYGRKNGVMQKLYSQGTRYPHAYIFTGACYGVPTNINEYGVRNFDCNGTNYNSVFMSNEALEGLDIRGNINMIIISRADSRGKFCFVSETTNELVCYGNGPSEEITLPNISLPYTFANIGSDYFGNSPFYGGGGNGGGNTTTITTGTICPMIQFEIDMYGTKYNTGLCYTNNIEFTGGTVQTVQPQSIFEIFNSYTDYINRYNLWNNSCHAPYTEEYCTNVMSENWRATQIFNKIEKAGVDSEKVYQYCHLQLHFTEEQKRTLGTCQIETETDQQQYATGTNQQNSNPNPLEGINNALQNGTLDEAPVPNTGTVFDEILPEGVLSRKDVLMDYNFYSHFSMLYIKITKLFQARGEQEGVIPPYITSLLLLILLFKIYKK